MNAKKFIIRLLLFTLICLPFIIAESIYTYITKSYEGTINGSEVYVSINKSKAKKKVKILLIGDSVGKQLYDNDTYNGDVYSLTCNQAISMAGYYILLKSFIDSNKQQLPGKVMLIITPTTFANNLDQVYTFHYFLKPFYTSANKALFTPACTTQIKKVPFYYLSQWPGIKNTNWSPTYNADKDTSFRFISPVSNNYLVRIKVLCSQYHIPFNIYGPPVKIMYKKQTLAYASSYKEFEKCGMSTEFATYFKNIEFLPDSLYQDHIHFKKEYIPKDYFKIGQ